MNDATEAVIHHHGKPPPPPDSSSQLLLVENSSDSDLSWDSSEPEDDNNGVLNKKKKRKLATSEVQLPPGFLDPLPPLPLNELEDSSANRNEKKVESLVRNGCERSHIMDIKKTKFCIPCIGKWVSDISELESFGISELITYLRREFQSAHFKKVDDKLIALERELTGYKNKANLDAGSEVSNLIGKMAEVNQCKSSRVSNTSFTCEKRIKTADVEHGKRVEQFACHQCLRNANEKVVRCMNCKTRRYCFLCIKKGYPQMSHVGIKVSCPACRGICNCKACLLKNGESNVFKEEMEISPQLLPPGVFDEEIGDLPRDRYMGVCGAELSNEVEDDFEDSPHSEEKTDEETKDGLLPPVLRVEHALSIKEMDAVPYKAHDCVPEVQLPILEIGMEFGSKDDFKCYLIDYCIRHRFLCNLGKNESHRLSVECRGRSTDGRKCTWRCYGSLGKDKSTFVVKILHSEHMCERTPKRESSWLDFYFVAMMIEPAMRENKGFCQTRDIQAAIWKRYQMNIAHEVASRARVRALEIIHGSFDKSYAMTPALRKQILVTNPGSLASVSVDPVNKRWRSLCVCFRASVEGWVNGCRSVLGLESCFLKGKHGGVCLAIVGLDGNNATFPVAICLSKSEDIEYWYEFFSQMEPFLSQHHSPLTFYSDREKGIATAINRVFPGARHRFCFRHLIRNMTQKGRDKSLEDSAWCAAKTYIKTEFDEIMLQLENKNKKAANWLKSIGPDHWSRSNFGKTSKCDYVTQNFTESFSKWILEVRDNPIGEIIKKYQLMLTSHINERRKKLSTMEDYDVVPMVKKNIEKKKQRTSEFVVKSLSAKLYSVESGTRNWDVNLEARSCSCGEWEVSGIPCLHAVCVIEKQKLSLAMYCSKYFSVAYYKITYSGMLHIIPDMKDWGQPEYVVLPPTKTPKLAE